MANKIVKQLVNSEAKESSIKQLKLLQEYVKQNKRFDSHLEKKQKLQKLNLPNKSLVFNSISEKHATLLTNRVIKFISKYKTKADSLRWVTLLDSVIYMDVDNVLARIKNISSELKVIREKLVDVHLIGSYELEIVNFDFNTKHANQYGRDKLDENTRNKILVLEELASRNQENPNFGNLIMPVKLEGSMVLVHIHAIVNFGKDKDNNINKFKKLISENSQWNEHWTQLHIEKLYATKSLNENIRILSNYMTKSGNERLMYKVFYGRDKNNQTTFELDAAIYKYPFDTTGMSKYEIRKKRNAMYDEIAYDNERHLTHSEIEFLNNATYELMISSRKTTKEGYLLII